MIDNQKVHKGGSNIPTTTPLTLAAQFAIFSQSLEGFFLYVKSKGYQFKRKYTIQDLYLATQNLSNLNESNTFLKHT